MAQKEIYEICYYQGDDGAVPYTKWMRKCRDNLAKAKILAKIANFKLGNMGDHKMLGGGVYEARINYAKGYRIYYGIDQGKVVLILCAGEKSTQKEDVEKAKEYWRDYQG